MRHAPPHPHRLRPGWPAALLLLLAQGSAGLQAAEAGAADASTDATVDAATADEAEAAPDAGTVVRAPLVIGGKSYTAQWYLPAGTALGFVQVQHGFSRKCPNLLDTTKVFMNEGLMAMCLNADMSGGNPKLADALAAALVAGLTAPDGRAVPERIVVAGHSAGGHFASRLGWALSQQAPQRLRGAVLFDPVAADASFTTNLQAVSAAGQRPVLAVTANPGVCNAQNNAYPALRQVQADALAAGRSGFVGVQLTQQSTHVDAEGKNTNFLGWSACLQGQPRAANTGRLRDLTGTWALDAVTGGRTDSDYPGGSYLQSLVDGGVAALID